MRGSAQTATRNRPAGPATNPLVLLAVLVCLSSRICGSVGQGRRLRQTDDEHSRGGGEAQLTWRGSSSSSGSGSKSSMAHLLLTTHAGAPPGLAAHLEKHLSRREAAHEWNDRRQSNNKTAVSTNSTRAPPHPHPQPPSQHQLIASVPVSVSVAPDGLVSQGVPLESAPALRVSPSVRGDAGNASASGKSGREVGARLPKKPAVVFARHKEDMGWVKRVLKDSHDAFDVHIYQSGNPKQRNFVPNAGFESTKYLKFIIDHYDALPPKVLFLHAHEKAGHNPCSPSTFLPRWHWATASGYVALPATVKTFPYTGFSNWDTIKWTDLLTWGQQLAGLPPRPYSPDHQLKLPMNAQFMASRERLLQHPRSTYEKLYAAGTRAPCRPPDWMKSRNPERPFLSRGCALNRLFGIAMEISWAAILSADQRVIRWKQGRKAGCFTVCNNKHGVYCQPPTSQHLTEPHPQSHRPLF